MEFEITKKLKRKARRKLIRGDKRLFGTRLAGYLMLIIGIMLLIYASTCGDPMTQSDLVFIAIFVDIAAIVVLLIPLNLASSQIQGRLNERVWYKNGKLYHFIQTAFAGGYNYRHADSTAYLFEMDMNSIREAVYDDKVGRLEFKCNGIGRHYDDYRRNSVDKQWALNGYTCVLYDCSDPKFVDFIREQGIEVKEQSIKIKLRDNRI